MPDIAELTMPTAQAPSKRGIESATPQSDRLLGHGEAALGEKVFDIPEAEGEPIIKPHGVTDDLGWEVVASIPRFHCLLSPRGEPT